MHFPFFLPSIFREALHIHCLGKNLISISASLKPDEERCTDDLVKLEAGYMVNWSIFMDNAH